MTTKMDPLDIAVPRNQTALMQHLQLLAGREGHRIWCGGVIGREKLPAFVAKMAARYPITRNTRQRTYDRTRGIAVTHFVAFPVGNEVHWWLLSDGGVGGLADMKSEDARVARDAMSADGHITFRDYVLLYATKREWREVESAKAGKRKGFYKQTSTWTWKLRGDVIRELRRSIEDCCEGLEYGSEGGNGQKPWGLRGLLASMRARPLFSAVRSQVLALHRDALELWKPRQALWCARHPALAQQYGQHAGALTPINELLATRMPKMRRIRVFDEQPITLRDLLPANSTPSAAPKVEAMQ
ncbi:hypothetical protein ACFSHT_06100 [Paraburkholderia silviterrae]|uniref:Uncharacterized protein n=1 Tax=Paraburkholderia silviterrae TaxID=2528715 RepID=A0A4R5MCA4_9BURK|nr:hypothetical protein [Paraburkholderia silviterrae]TDG24479.1 hypothetical protein EYW47_07895 [Paraburkholderia silviterrae]